MRECPFCGGEARAYLSDAYGDCLEWIAQCENTHTLASGYETEAEAVEAWNTRVEPTCEVVERYQARNPLERGREQVKLSCGHYAERHSKYCGKCGRKIVDGDTSKVVVSATEGLTSDHPRKWFELSCGHSFCIDGLGGPVACPICGRKVNS